MYADFYSPLFLAILINEICQSEFRKGKIFQVVNIFYQNKICHSQIFFFIKYCHLVMENDHIILLLKYFLATLTRKIVMLNKLKTLVNFV